MLNSEFHNALKRYSLEKHLNNQELETLFIHNKMMTFSAGETILQQGKPSSGIFIIISGIVNVTTRILGEGVVNLETFGQGHFLGEMSYIEKSPCTTSIIANNEVQCLFISNVYLTQLSIYFPETKYKLFNAISKQMCDQIKKIHDKIIEIISDSNMKTKPLFGELIQSLTKPIKISFEDANIKYEKLCELSALQCFTKDEIETLLKHTILLKAAKNCTLIYKNEKNPCCYIVLHGAVLSSITHDNKVAKLSVIGPGTLLASIACIDNNASFTITFSTCEQAILLKLSESDLIFLQKNHPELWYKLFNLIVQSLAALQKSVNKLDIRLNIETYNR